MLLKIKYIVEISDHDGYCSGGECEFQVKRRTKIVTCPFMPDYEVGSKIPLWEYDFATLLPPWAKLNVFGSNYCKTSEESKEHNLHGHDYRYVVYSVRRVD